MASNKEPITFRLPDAPASSGTGKSRLDQSLATITQSKQAAQSKQAVP
jgi:hypothetical protein